MNKRLLMVVFLIMVLTLNACGQTDSLSENKEYITASWTRSYANIEELSLNSNVIALVEVVQIEETVIQMGVPYTTFLVEVLTPIYNTTEGERFIIYMTGGEKNGTVVEVEDDPLLQIGEECLVFCKENPDGTYQILSGPQGRLVHQNGKLNSLGVINKQISEKSSISNVITVENMDVSDVITQIKDYIENAEAGF